MEPTLASLEKRLQLSAGELKKVVLGCPTLLGLSWEENMEPQIAMMEEAVGHVGAAAGVKELILRTPIVFTYSNEKRVRPRLAELKALSQGVDRSMLYAVCTDTDVRWEERMADLGRVGTISP